MKAKRKALMAARLKKVQQHKLGQTADTSVEDKEEDKGEGQEEGQREEHVDKREGGVPPEAGKRHIRPWDRGKSELQQCHTLYVCARHLPCPSLQWWAPRGGEQSGRGSLSLLHQHLTL